MNYLIIKENLNKLKGITLGLGPIPITDFHEEYNRIINKHKKFIKMNFKNLKK